MGWHWGPQKSWGISIPIHPLKVATMEANGWVHDPIPHHFQLEQAPRGAWFVRNETGILLGGDFREWWRWLGLLLVLVELLIITLILRDSSGWESSNHVVVFDRYNDCLVGLIVHGCGLLFVGLYVLVKWFGRMEFILSDETLTIHWRVGWVVRRKQIPQTAIAAIGRLQYGWYTVTTNGKSVTQPLYRIAIQDWSGGLIRVGMMARQSTIAYLESALRVCLRKQLGEPEPSVCAICGRILEQEELGGKHCATCGSLRVAEGERSQRETIAAICENDKLWGGSGD